jgi:hypothetical protein
MYNIPIFQEELKEDLQWVVGYFRFPSDFVEISFRFPNRNGLTIRENDILLSFYYSRPDLPGLSGIYLLNSELCENSPIRYNAIDTAHGPAIRYHARRECCITPFVHFMPFLRNSISHLVQTYLCRWILNEK